MPCQSYQSRGLKACLQCISSHRRVLAWHGKKSHNEKGIYTSKLTDSHDFEVCVTNKPVSTVDNFNVYLVSKDIETVSKGLLRRLTFPKRQRIKRFNKASVTIML